MAIRIDVLEEKLVFFVGSIIDKNTLLAESEWVEKVRSEYGDQCLPLDIRIDESILSDNEVATKKIYSSTKEKLEGVIDTNPIVIELIKEIGLKTE